MQHTFAADDVDSIIWELYVLLLHLEIGLIFIITDKTSKILTKSILYKTIWHKFCIKVEISAILTHRQGHSIHEIGYPTHA